jgi:DNA-binding NtrC family response regulator
MDQQHLLIIDDEVDMLQGLSRVLSLEHRFSRSISR